jgi:hypothetical protein
MRDVRCDVLALSYIETSFPNCSFKNMNMLARNYLCYTDVTSFFKHFFHRLEFSHTTLETKPTNEYYTVICLISFLTLSTPLLY